MKRLFVLAIASVLVLAPLSNVRAGCHDPQGAAGSAAAAAKDCCAKPGAKCCSKPGAKCCATSDKGDAAGKATSKAKQDLKAPVKGSLDLSGALPK